LDAAVRQQPHAELLRERRPLAHRATRDEEPGDIHGLTARRDPDAAAVGAHGAHGTVIHRRAAGSDRLALLRADPSDDREDGRPLDDGPEQGQGMLRTRRRTYDADVRIAELVAVTERA